MAERLIIENFGPIKSIDIELRKMTVLIGPQASGKSTIAKVLGICRYFSSINLESLKDQVTPESLFLELKDNLRHSGINDFWNANSIIRHKGDDFNLQIKDSQVICSGYRVPYIGNVLKDFLEYLSADGACNLIFSKNPQSQDFINEFQKQVENMACGELGEHLSGQRSNCNAVII